VCYFFLKFDLNSFDFLLQSVGSPLNLLFVILPFTFNYLYIMILVPKIFNAQKIIAAQSTRLGGVSSTPFDSLNLGMSVNDDEKSVQKNRELFFGNLGIPLNSISRSHQVHGNKVLLVNSPTTAEGYDALITDKVNNFLAVSIADCTPVLIHDEQHNAVAAIHAGWKGTVGRIVENTLLEMQQHFGTQGKDCKAFIGACISYSNFEVGEDVAVHFSNDVKRFDTEKQKWFVNLKAANKNQLTDFGVQPEHIEISDYCTVTNNDLFFSHRKEKGTTGRMMAVIGIK